MIDLSGSVVIDLTESRGVDLTWADLRPGDLLIYRDPPREELGLGELGELVTRWHFDQTSIWMLAVWTRPSPSGFREHRCVYVGTAGLVLPLRDGFRYLVRQRRRPDPSEPNDPRSQGG